MFKSIIKFLLPSVLAAAATSIVPTLETSTDTYLYYLNVTVGTPDSLYPSEQTSLLVLDVNSAQSYLFIPITSTCLGCSPVDMFYNDDQSTTFYTVSTESANITTEGWLFTTSSLGVD